MSPQLDITLSGAAAHFLRLIEGAQSSGPETIEAVTRNQITVANYTKVLTAMQTRLQAAASTAGRGTEEFALIDRQIISPPSCRLIVREIGEGLSPVHRADGMGVWST